MSTLKTVTEVVVVGEVVLVELVLLVGSGGADDKECFDGVCYGEDDDDVEGDNDGDGTTKMVFQQENEDKEEARST
eukprot:767189-Hanusia_phi.AAC.3